METNLDLHGDVVIIPKPLSFEGMKVRKDNCLAYGEVTGHAHRLSAHGGATVAVYENEAGEVAGFEVFGGDGAYAELSHEEHHTITMKPGTYEVRIQRTCDPFTSKEGDEWRAVQD